MRWLLLMASLCVLLAGCTPNEMAALQGQLDALSGPANSKQLQAAPDSAAGELWPGVCNPSQASGFGGVEPHVARVGHRVQALFGLKTVFGVEVGSVADSDHPKGLALDFMVGADRALGDRVAAHVLANWSQYGVTYVIWKQRIDEGAGWNSMADRGSVTANHFDHVHVSFRRSPPAGFTCRASK